MGARGGKIDGGNVEFDIQACSCMAGLVFQVLAIFGLVSSWRSFPRGDFSVYAETDSRIYPLLSTQWKLQILHWSGKNPKKHNLHPSIKDSCWPHDKMQPVETVINEKSIAKSRLGKQLKNPISWCDYCCSCRLSCWFKKRQLFIILIIYSSNYINNRFGWNQASCFCAILI